MLDRICPKTGYLCQLSPVCNGIYCPPQEYVQYEELSVELISKVGDE